MSIIRSIIKQKNFLRSCQNGFSLLEILLASSLMLIISFMITHVFVIAMAKIEIQKKYTNYLENSQFLYWYFFNNITENIGIFNLDNISKPERLLNNKLDKESIDVLVNQPKVKILDYNSFSKIKENSAYSSSKLDKQSDILEINYYLLDELNNTEPLKAISKFYYIAKAKDNENSYSLYEYYNRRQEELVTNIHGLKVKQYIINKNIYYKFSFQLNYKNSRSDISFVIRNSLFTHATDF